MIETDYDYRPEQPVAKKIGKCEVCGNDIFEEYEYFDFDNVLVCSDCFIDYCYKHFKKGE